MFQVSPEAEGAGFPFDQESANGRPVSVPEDAPMWLQSLLNDVGFGIIILDSRLRPFFCNDNARAAMYGVGLEYLAELTLHEVPDKLLSRREAREFLQCAANAAKGQRTLILLGHAQQQFALAFSPLRLFDASEECGVLVTTERREVCEVISLWAYGRVQGMTRAEIRVLEELAAGKEPKLVAQYLNVSVTTVRTHIKSMLGKTDSSTMRDLLLKVARLPPIRPLPCAVGI